MEKKEEMEEIMKKKRNWKKKEEGEKEAREKKRYREIFLLCGLKQNSGTRRILFYPQTQWVR